MMKKQKHMNLAMFFAGVLVTLVLMFVFFTDQKSHADQYSCIRQDLNAVGMTGNMPNPEFTITYDVPRCYLENGYTVERVWMYGSQVAVRYKKQ